jgi:small redox-active disulfide protein 2
VGGAKVGLVGLDEALDAALELSGKSDGELADFLVERVRAKNYIPAAAEDRYGESLLRELKKTLGEPGEEDSPAGWEIKVLGPGCARCEELYNMAMRAVALLEMPASVDYVKDVKEIASHGVVQVPAVVVNGRVLFAGRVPTFDALKDKFAEIL